MIQADKETTYRAVRARAGNGERGQWALVAIADEKNDKRTMTIFLDNLEIADQVQEGMMFKIKDISKVKYGWKKDNRGAWVPDTTISATIEIVKSAIDGFNVVDGVIDVDGPSPWDDTDWGELPL